MVAESGHRACLCPDTSLPAAESEAMRRLWFWLWVPAVLWNLSAVADYRITRDHGGLVDQYKLKYAAIRDHGGRVIIC